MKRFWHSERARRIFAYGVVVLATAYGLWQVGPVQRQRDQEAKHREQIREARQLHKDCLRSNETRSDIRLALHVTITGLGTPDQVSALDKTVQDLLLKNLGPRDCSKVGLP